MEGGQGKSSSSFPFAADLGVLAGDGKFPGTVLILYYRCCTLYFTIGCTISEQREC